MYPCACLGKFTMSGLVPSCFVITSRRKLMSKDEGHDCIMWESKK